MKRILIWLLLTVLNVGCCVGQNLQQAVLSPYLNIGAYSGTTADVFSFTANQASLAQLKSNSLGLVLERRFFLKELSQYTAVAAMRTRFGNVALKAVYYGFSDYNETQLGFAYARRLTTKVDVGVQFNYNGFRIPTYGGVATVGVEAGILLHISEKLHTGFRVCNPVARKFGAAGLEKLASLYSLGLGYEPSEKVFVTVEILKEQDQPVNVNAGFQYKLVDLLFTRGGVTTNTSTLWLGIGMVLKKFRLDIMSAYHPQLGVTPGLLLVFSLSPKVTDKKNEIE